MELSPELKEELLQIGKTIGKNLVMTGVTAAATLMLKKLLVTNYEKKDLAGNKSYSVTEDEKTLAKSEVEGNKNEGSLANDSVSAQKGKIDAASTDAAAAQTEATAADTGATAMKTKAGAMDVATKALKLN